MEITDITFNIFSSAGRSPHTALWFPFKCPNLGALLDGKSHKLIIMCVFSMSTKIFIFLQSMASISVLRVFKLVPALFELNSLPEWWQPGPRLTILAFDLLVSHCCKPIVIVSTDYCSNPREDCRHKIVLCPSTCLFICFLLTPWMQKRCGI